MNTTAQQVPTSGAIFGGTPREMDKLLCHDLHHPASEEVDSYGSTTKTKAYDLYKNKSTSGTTNRTNMNSIELLPSIPIAATNVYHQYGGVNRDDPNLPLYALLAKKASPPDIDQQEFIRRSTFMLISLLKLFACIVWGIMYLVLNDRAASVMPFFYLCFVLSNFTYCALVEEGYERFVFVQLALILIFPMLVHLVLGGLQGSGGVMLWSFLSPVSQKCVSPLRQ